MTENLGDPGALNEEVSLEDEDEDEDFETLPCSWTYVAVCLILPILNGGLNGFMWPGYSLHFVEMGWPVVYAGLAVTLGYWVRTATQQVQLRAGYWLIVPLASVHLAVAILALIYTTELWAVFAQVVVFLGIDPTCAVEGIAFDSFGASEIQAKQANSTMLSVYTIAVALSCTLGGIIYDFAGWRGVSMYHSICQGLQLFLLCLQPAVRKSFEEVFFSKSKADEAEAEANTSEVFTKVVPDADVRSLVVKEIDELDCHSEAERKQSSLPEATRTSEHVSRGSDRWASARASQQSKRASHRPSANGEENVVLRRLPRSSRASRASRARNSLASRLSTGTRHSVFSAVSNMTPLDHAGQDFRHHFGTSTALQVSIVGATGAKAVMRLDGAEAVDQDEQVVAPPAKAGSIPKDVRFPCFLIVLNAFCANATYTIEFATFAIFFKQVHNWNEATWASLAQTAGDVTAAVAMQVIPYVFTSEYDPDDLGCFRRFLHYLVSQPYNLSLILIMWVLFNAGLVSPWLPVAIVSQIFMGTVYVYSSKWVTDMNLFYSLGDSKVFMTLQVYCRNAEALGGSIAGLFGTWLFTVDPVLPYAFSAVMAGLFFVVYTVGFCARLGYGVEIETAEERRARRLGKKRVSSWKSQRSTSSTKRSTVRTNNTSDPELAKN